jgi:outer membrane beta-barrel protein
VDEKIGYFRKWQLKDVNMRKGLHLSTALFVLVFFIAQHSFAQEEDLGDTQSDVDQIEAELEKRAAKTQAPETPVVEKDEKLEDFSGLGKLAPFSEVSVLQRKYLPKTGRFQFYGALTNVVNDPWFMGLGVDARGAYHLTEAWGVELQGVFLSNSKRQSVDDLDKQHGVKTDSIISAKGYYGASILWNPIYGKMGLLNKRIIPFDMYFSLGGGTTTVDGGTGGTTLHFGLGQIFALSKGMGFRWDFSWNNYSAKPNASATTPAPEAQAFNTLMLSAGVSFFFPEAKYR